MKALHNLLKSIYEMLALYLPSVQFSFYWLTINLSNQPFTPNKTSAVYTPKSFYLKALYSLIPPNTFHGLLTKPS